MADMSERERLAAWCDGRAAQSDYDAEQLDGLFDDTAAGNDARELSANFRAIAALLREPAPEGWRLADLETALQALWQTAFEDGAYCASSTPKGRSRDPQVPDFSAVMAVLAPTPQSAPQAAELLDVAEQTIARMMQQCGSPCSTADECGCHQQGYLLRAAIKAATALAAKDREPTAGK